MSPEIHRLYKHILKFRFDAKALGWRSYFVNGSLIVTGFMCRLF